MILEHSYTHRGYTVEIFSKEKKYSSFVYIPPKSSDWENRVFEGCFFLSLEEAIENADEFIDELCINHN